MNTNMYLNDITQENMKKLEGLGYEFITPGVGMLACQTYGPGRMAEPVDIVEYLIDSLKEKEMDFENKKVVVSAGPTVEEIDPVRYITNYSSGKMGYEIAKKARNRGAEVVLVTGPTSLDIPSGMKVVKVKSTDDMLNAIEDEFENTDVLIKAAAVADYKVKNKSKEKIKKEGRQNSLTLDLVENIDIAQYFGSKKDKQLVIGFAAETNNLIENAKKKLDKKHLDFVVANDVSKEGAGFDVDTNIISIVDKDTTTEYNIMGKDKIADIILDKAIDTLREKAR